jgi:hypothetical protein
MAEKGMARKKKNEDGFNIRTERDLQQEFSTIYSLLETTSKEREKNIKT